MSLLLLYLLATLDAGFSGYRAAAGRNALIHKGGYYRRAVLWGMLAGQGAAVLLGLAVGLVLLASADRADFLRAADRALPRLLVVYLPYSTVIAAMLALRAVPSADLRSVTSLAVFGPAVVLRPLVGAAGVGWMLIADPRPGLALLGGAALLLWWSLPALLSRWVAHWWRRAAAGPRA